MGINYSATLSYGFEINSDLRKEVYFPNGLSIVEHGSLYYNDDDDSLLYFVVIKESVNEVCLCDDPVEFEKLSVKKSWKEKLMDFAKKNDILDPKIGWRLCILES